MNQPDERLVADLRALDDDSFEASVAAARAARNAGVTRKTVASVMSEQAAARTRTTERNTP